MPRLSSTVVALLAVSLGGAACGQAAPSPSASVSQAGSASASASPSGTGVAELRASSEPLAPGRYTRSAFSPAITFELDGPWYAVQLYDGFFDVQQDPGSPDVIAVQFARPSGVYGAGGSLVETDSAEEAATALQANPGLAVLGTSASRIGGLDGFVVEVENPGTSGAQVMLVPPGPLSILAERRLWVAFFDTADGLLAIMVGGSVAKWNEALAAAEPVLESVQIGE